MNKLGVPNKRWESRKRVGETVKALENARKLATVPGQKEQLFDELDALADKGRQPRATIEEKEKWFNSKAEVVE